MQRLSGKGLTRRGLGRGLAAAAGTGLIYGTGIAPAIGQTRRDLHVGMFGSDFGNLSPLIRTDIPGSMIQFNIIDPLASIDYANRKIMPLAAEAWSNPDPLTWRIKLREGMKWQKGYGEVTAADLLYTWNYHIESKSFQVATTLFPVDTMKLDGKYVLEVKTKQPFGAFAGTTMCYGGLMVSEKAHKEMGNDAYSAMPVGNGSFMLKSNSGPQIVLVRNPDYWQPNLPKLDRVVYQVVPDSLTRLEALEKGEFDFVTHPDPQHTAELKKNGNLTVSSTPGWEWDYQCFNLVKRPNAPFQHKALRQAISWAIDRQAIVDEIYYGQAIATDNPIPAGFIGHRGQFVRYTPHGDLKKARDLIAQAGLHGYTVDVITSDKDWLRKELELVAAMVSQIGINYNIKDMDMGGYNNLWLNQNFDQLLEDITIIAPDPDAATWWFLHTGGSVSAYSNPKMDAMLDGARGELDQAKRETMYHNIVDMTLEECPMIYHSNSNNIRVYNKKLVGFSPSPQEYVEKLDTLYWT